MKDERQLRTANNTGLIGYRASYHGEIGIAIMKGTDEKSWKCLGYISQDDLNEKLKTGPTINLEQLI